MPGSDDQYDQVHTYSQDHAGKSKTTKPAVRELGRDGAPVRLFVGDERDETQVRTPPTGVVYTFINTSGNPRVIDSTGTIASPVDGQAISPASVTTGKVDYTNQEVVYLFSPTGEYKAAYDFSANGSYAGIGSAFNAAMTDSQNSESLILLPAGTHEVDTTLVIDTSNTWVVGHGMRVTRLDNNIDQDAIEIAEGLGNIHLRDFYIAGTGTSGNSDNGINLQAPNNKWSEIYLTRIWIFGCGRRGLQWGDFGGAGGFFAKFDTVRVTGCKSWGMVDRGGSQEVFINCWFADNDGGNILMDGATNVNMDGVTCGSTTASSNFQLQACRVFHIGRLYMENNDNANGLDIQSDCNDFTISVVRSFDCLLDFNGNRMNLGTVYTRGDDGDVTFGGSAEDVRVFGDIYLNSGSATITFSGWDIEWPGNPDHNGAESTDGDSDNSISISFDTPFDQKPKLLFDNPGEITDVSLTTNADGRYDGATLTVGTAGATVRWKAAK